MCDVLVIAPHPDDETFGCGGSLLKHKDAGDRIHWLIMTNTNNDNRYSDEFTSARNIEINKVKEFYCFESVNILCYKPATLDQSPLGNIIKDINNVVQSIKPKIIYMPYRGDAHTDHKVTFDAAVACTKSFRSPFVTSVRIYETLSETDFGSNPDINGFRPNYFINIEKYLDRKVDILRIFSSEISPPPFPRSIEAVRALALLRGQIAGTIAAEAFMLIKEVWND